MNRLRRVVAIAALLWCPVGVGGQYQTIELADVQIAKSLGATVQDPTGAPVRNAVVEEFDADWKTQLRAGSTDADGKFSFTPVTGRKIYFIQVSSPGFDLLRFRLRVDGKYGTSIKLKLTVAT